MELWNAFDDEKKYSLEEIILVEFKAKYLKEKKVNSNLMSEDKMVHELEKIWEDPKLYDKFINQEENYIGNEMKRINKMIGLIIGAENKKLIYKNRTEKIFNHQNCIFFAFILETFHFEDSKLLRKGEIDQVSDEFLDYLYKGMKGLADNPDTLLSMEVVDKRWNTRFSNSYRRFLSTYNIFEMMMKIFVNKVMEQDDKDLLFSEIEEKLDICMLNIAGINDELSEAMILRNNFEE